MLRHFGTRRNGRIRVVLKMLGQFKRRRNAILIPTEGKKRAYDYFTAVSNNSLNIKRRLFLSFTLAL